MGIILLWPSGTLRGSVNCGHDTCRVFVYISDLQSTEVSQARYSHVEHLVNYICIFGIVKCSKWLYATNAASIRIA